MEEEPRIKELLDRFAAGEAAAADELMPHVYQELKLLARGYLRRERPGHTLQATALVHEAYLRLAVERGESWQGRAHFLALAARLMRQILTDHARRRNAAKRGWGVEIVPIQEGLHVSERNGAFLPELDEALNRLAEIDARAARVVEMRFFGGLTEEEAAEVMGVSTRTIKRLWASARAWLYGELMP